MQYLPENTIDDLFYKYYSSFLSKLNQESIYEKMTDISKHIYRFIWLRSFHDPITITIEILDKEYGELHFQKFNVSRFYSENEIVINNFIKLTPININILLGVIKECDFWGAPSKNPYSHGLDGSTWIIEGLREGKYHIIERWSPINMDEVSAGIGLKMLDLSRIKINKIY